MIENNHTIKLRHWLSPLAILYGIGVTVRNKLFDWGMLSSTEYPLPIISVGNINAGGTGKTPHIEHLVKLLSPTYNVAVLSRGYKRKTRGYRLATEHSTPREIGDEPYQIKQKFPHITVAVDGDRRRGIAELLKREPAIEVILLDDAFQHRYVAPSYSIMLMDYNRLITEDRLLPVGSLREPASSKTRANMVIVTKCPDNIKPMDFRIIYKHLDLFPYQQMHFTGLSYFDIKPLFSEESEGLTLAELATRKVLLVAGIANPAPFEHYMSERVEGYKLLTFSDHHNFSKGDIATITTELARLDKEGGVVVTTEKDAVRLAHLKELPEALRGKIYYLPLEIKFLQDREKMFHEKIIKHVESNKRNSAIHTQSR